jgi:hypothetical protein
MRFIALGVVLGVLVLPVGSSAATSAASLRLLDHSPAVVRGTGFKPGERVTVRAYVTSGTRSRALDATRAGTFTVQFALSAGGCAGARAFSATGSRGSRASLKLLVPECPPPADATR